jgi:hypothetical protein
MDRQTTGLWRDIPGGESVHGTLDKELVTHSLNDVWNTRKMQKSVSYHRNIHDLFRTVSLGRKHETKMT